MELTWVHRLGIFLRRCGHTVDIRAHVPFSATWDFAEECFELVRTCTLLLLILGVIDGRIQLRNRCLTLIKGQGAEMSTQFENKTLYTHNVIRSFTKKRMHKVVSTKRS